MAKKALPVNLTNRIPLQEVIPLDTPYSVLVSPIDYCNIKCIFCPFHGEVKGDNREPAIMDFELLKKIVDQLTEFPNKLKAFIFCGRGEPTLNKDLPDMIAYLKSKNVTNEIRLTTNGFNLSPELNKKLIDAGLDYIKISVPAIDEKTCFEITGAKLDLEKYIKNIKNLFDNKREGMTVFCKTTNIALDGKNGKPLSEDMSNKFYDMFNNCCDYCFIENIVPQVIRELSDEEREKMWIGNTSADNVYSVKNDISPVCERLFYHFTVNSLGNVYTCDLNESEDLFLGNVENISLSDIWNSDKFRNIRISFLKGNIPSSCKNCGIFTFDFPNELHKYSDEIYEKIMSKNKKGV